METKNIELQRERIIEIIHNLVWFRISLNENYIAKIPEIESSEFHIWIYFIDYQFIEYDDSVVRAVLYLNEKHYEYTYYPNFMKSVSVNEIKESEVKAKIIEFGGVIWEGFELYDPDVEIDPESAATLNEIYKYYSLNKRDSDYNDLPF